MADSKYTADQYHNGFDPKIFLDTFYKVDFDEMGLLAFLTTGVHDFWSNFHPGSSKNADGIRCLEYGGGPTVLDLISAAPKVDRIVFSDYTEANTQAVLSWIAGNPETFNWKPFIEYVVSDLEGDKSATAVLKREEELKRKIKSIVPCDVNKAPIVDFEDEDVGKPFDVVSLSFCLEVVTSEKQYKDSVAKLCHFLKLNGYLRMNGLLKETFYRVGEQKYPSFSLTKTIVKEALKEAKLKDIMMEVYVGGEHRVENSVELVSDSISMFMVSGRK